MTTERQKRKRLTRSATVDLKASKLVEALGEERPREAAAEVPSVEAPALTSAIVRDDAQTLHSLGEEIKALRKQLAEKTAAHRLLSGKESGEGSKTVAQVIAMLSASAGASKAQLIAETGAKKGYVDALLNRILPSRGYVVTSVPVDGARARAYRLASPSVAE